MASLLVLARNNLAFEGMWWDESAQFWISQGLSNYAQPFEPRRGIRDLVRFNRTENLDPGGFSLLLHWWTRYDRGFRWLRSLPFLFFVLGSLGVALLGWRLTGSKSLALGAFAVPLLYPQSLYFAFEIRAYSMDMCGVAWGVLLFVRAVDHSSFSRLSQLGLLCALFLTSRYSYVLFVAGLACACWVEFARRGDSPPLRLKRLLIVLTPGFIVGVAIIHVTLRHQLWPEMKHTALGVTAPIYTRAAVLGATANVNELLYQNLLSPPALPITFAIVALLFLRRPAYAAAVRKWGPGLAQTAERFTPLYVLIFSIQLLSSLVSLLNYYPWDISSRWSAYLLMVSALSTVVLIAEVTVIARQWLARAGDGAFAGHITHAGILALSIVVALAFRHSLIYRQRIPWIPVAGQVRQVLVASPKARSVLVTYYEVPVLRYLYEFGPFAGHAEYPRLFRFETGREWGQKGTIHPKAEGIEFIVTAMSLEEARARYPGAALRAVGPPDSRLFAVVSAQDR